MKDDIMLIASKYKKQSDTKNKIKELYIRYLKNRERTLLDATIATLALGSILEQGSQPELTPQMEEAFHLAFPHLDLEDVASYDTTQLQGLLSAWKGKYFEVLVRDTLNNGEHVGDLGLEPGQVAELAEDPTQPGWDLLIRNDDGTVAQEIQLKATESLSYIKDAIEKYPDIQIMSTDEVLHHSDAIVEHILNAGISNTEITDHLSKSASAIQDSSAFEDIMDFTLPGLPFILITLGEGRQVLMGKKPFEMALADGLDRAIKSGVAMGVGGLVAFLDGGLLSIPATFMTRLGIDRFQVMGKSADLLEERSKIILDLKPLYSFGQGHSGK
ncbi:hypothetical protein ACI7RC_27435 [Brevibacillus sp. B_LB10_24]|uniref:hypothetical protein n=1 Tax=Brevibacillus sp. B_LB10_24 TaxID=3380645 RepID=UPI0038BB9631